MPCSGYKKWVDCEWHVSLFPFNPAGHMTNAFYYRKVLWNDFSIRSRGVTCAINHSLFLIEMDYERDFRSLFYNGMSH